MRHGTPLTLVGKALSHPVREKMLWLLEAGERCGCEFAPVLHVDPSMISRSLAILERAGLVNSRRDGVRVMWSLASPQVLSVLSELRDIVLAESVSV